MGATFVRPRISNVPVPFAEMRKFCFGAVASFVLLAGIGVESVEATSDAPASTTTTTIGYELSDDFLTLYPGFDDDQYHYLLPDDPLLPKTGPQMRVGIGALALLAFGGIMFALARGPWRKRRRPLPPAPH